MFGKMFLTMTCNYTPVTELDAEMLTPTFGTPEEIPCLKYGDKTKLWTAETKDTVSDQVYLLDRKVNPGDIIDGQVVVNCFEYLDRPGYGTEVGLYEVRVTVKEE